jgi:small subunit ribosomal protein S7|tara:strand:- start:20 stop:487 length:468 start_codon:yes stop_codon:yes gene_type:complete
MSRRHRANKRDILPDAKFGDTVVTKFINNLMEAGKKATAERIVYGAFEKIKGANDSPIDVFNGALNNVKPSIEVRSRRVGGATYQVPTEVSGRRAEALAIRWIISSARSRSEKTMIDRLAKELQEASGNKGSAVKKREDTHKMAEANRAFAHYRW